MMKKIAIVTDSTAVINNDYITENSNLYVLPLHIIFTQDEVYQDGIDISPMEFFQKLETVSCLPTTSQPSVGEAMELFEELLKDYDEIIYITISSKISGTFSTGQAVARLLSNHKVEIFDSLNTSVIQKYYVEEAVRLTKLGKSSESILKHLEKIRSQSEIYLVVDDLRHLGRTGRLNNMGAIIGSLLKIKPILHFEHGFINLNSKVRTLRKAYSEAIKKLLNDEIDGHTKVMIAHANGLDNAIHVQKLINHYLPDIDIEICELSPVISVHTGPNSVGVAWVKNR